MSDRKAYISPQRQKRSVMIAPLAILLILAAGVFGLGMFFRVSEIEVVGAESYSEEEIIDASGIELGDNLLFVNVSRDSGRIFSKLAYVESASITRELPNKVIITVNESYAIAYVDWEGEYWSMTAGCKMLTSVSEENLGNLIHVTDIIPLDPTEGEIMQVDESESLKLTYLQSLLSAIEGLNIANDVTDIDLDNPADPHFTYLGRFLVKMGPNENTEYKLHMLLAAVDQVDAEVTGTMDLSEGTTVHMSPD